MECSRAEVEKDLKDSGRGNTCQWRISGTKSPQTSRVGEGRNQAQSFATRSRVRGQDLLHQYRDGGSGNGGGEDRGMKEKAEELQHIYCERSPPLKMTGVTCIYDVCI